jgi:predicted enzyme related to lactoylglutathione lyase
MTSRISALSIDAADPAGLAEFWCAVLGWRVIERSSDGVSIAGIVDGWPVVDFLLVPEKKAVKNRLHLDLCAENADQPAELRRLLALGAVRTDVGQPADVTWVVLADPEGNEFCLLAEPDQD